MKPSNLEPIPKFEDVLADCKEKEICRSLVISMLQKMTDEDRLSVFLEFCVHCGNKHQPCYCTRDD